MSLPTLKLISTSGMLANARNWLLEHARASIYFTVLSTCSISETVRDRDFKHVKDSLTQWVYLISLEIDFLLSTFILPYYSVSQEIETC